MKILREGWGFFLLFIVATVLQFALARQHSLWADEFFSLAMATGHSLEHRAADAQPHLGDFVESQVPVPAAEFRRYLQHESPPASPVRVIRAVLLSDTSPPLYYLLLEGWTLIVGTTDLALRLFSVSFSIASLPLVAAVARRIAGPRAALASCVLFALSPLVIYYSTEGRMYSLLVFLTLGTALVSLLLQERGPRVGICLLWVVLSAAGFLTHYFFVFPWLANAVFLFLQPGKFQRRWLLLCGVATGLIISSARSPAAVQRRPPSALALVNRRLCRTDRDRSIAAYVYSSGSAVRVRWRSGSLPAWGDSPFFSRSKPGWYFTLSGRGCLVARII